MIGGALEFDEGWGATNIFQIAMLKEVFNEEELDEWYTD